MKPLHHRLILGAMLATLAGNAWAQTSGASQAKAWGKADTDVAFRMDDTGKQLPRIAWGLDLCWLSEGNLQRGANFAGQDMIDIVRVGFRPTESVAGGALGSDQTEKLNERLGYMRKHTPNAKVNLGADTGDADLVNSWYKPSNTTTYGQRWTEMMRLHKLHAEQQGFQVASVSPFNEPDYGWGQGGKAEFRAICQNIRANSDFDGVLISGGNTLNDDQATPWFDYLKDYLDQGNTHQLAGSFANFAAFFTHVAQEGKQGVLDEMHNIIEPMVASEYGMTQGIWWGTCEFTRSEFMRATRGQRLGYAENRAKWTAASVFRMPERQGMPGERRVKGFVGTSERQANTTTYRFVEPTHEVWYDGVGPTREYVYTIPGGTGYQQGQVNAEGHVTIQDGEDIMPLINEGSYRIANRFSGLMLNGSSQNGGNVTQARSSLTSKNQEWALEKLPASVVGDRNVWFLKTDGVAMDVRDWSLEDGGEIISYPGGLGVNEQWCLEYAGEGAFFIRSMHSGLYLQMLSGTDAQQKLAGRKMVQANFTGDKAQQWVLLPLKTAYDAVAPTAPTQLTATALPSGVKLQWEASTARDLLGYTVLRSTDQQRWNTINRYLTETEYVDNTAVAGQTYYYKVKAQDKSYNHSVATDAVEAMPTGEEALLARLFVDADTLADASGLGNHAAAYATPSFVDASLGQGDNTTTCRAMNFDGSTQFVQLPAAVSSSQDFTFCAWLYWQNNATWQRIFDFGTDTDHYLFLTPKNSYDSHLRFAIKCGGEEQLLSASKAFPLNGWHHVALTMAPDAVTIYLDGQVLASTTDITLRPSDVAPAFCYLGRSMFASDPLLKGRLADVRIYNYALTADNVARVAMMEDIIPTGIDGCTVPQQDDKAAAAAYTLDGRPIDANTRGIVVRQGKKSFKRN